MQSLRTALRAYIFLRAHGAPHLTHINSIDPNSLSPPTLDNGQSHTGRANIRPTGYMQKPHHLPTEHRYATRHLSRGIAS